MKLAHYDLREPIYFEENYVNILILENGAHFRNTIGRFMAQCGGEDGDWVLSDDGETLSLSRCAELVSDPFSPDFDSKHFQQRINKAAAEAAFGMEEKTFELLKAINQYANELLLGLDFSADFNELDNPEPLIKLLGLSIEKNILSFPEQIIEYMLLCRKFFGKKLFIFVNLKDCLTRDELQSFYKELFYNKLDLLIIESHISDHTLPCEKKRIIDYDLCEIY